MGSAAGPRPGFVLRLITCTNETSGANAPDVSPQSTRKDGYRVAVAGTRALPATVVGAGCLQGVPRICDDRLSRRSGAERAFPEADDTCARAVHPGRRGELVPASDQEVVAHIDANREPEPGRRGALEEEPHDWWVLNQ